MHRFFIEAVHISNTVKINVHHSETVSTAFWGEEQFEFALSELGLKKSMKNVKLK